MALVFRNRGTFAPRPRLRDPPVLTILSPITRLHLPSGCCYRLLLLHPPDGPEEQGLKMSFLSAGPGTATEPA